MHESSRAERDDAVPRQRLQTAHGWSSLPRHALSRVRLHGCDPVGDAPTVSGHVWVKGGGRVHVGDRVVVDAREAPVELFAHQGAEIYIGDDVRFDPGASVVALGLVTVGNRVEFGAFSKVLDSHYHPLEGDRGNRPFPVPVVIEDDVVIGPKAVLLPGAHVLARTRVPAGAVVSRRGRGHAVEPQAPVALETATPRGAIHRARQVVQLGRAWTLFGRPAIGKRIFCGPGMRVFNAGTMVLGDGIMFFGGMLPTEVACRSGAALEIGAGGRFGYGTSIDAATSIVIGARCLVGTLVQIRDRDERGERPIAIGDDVWLAHGVVVHPGVRIGHRAVVGAGSVVKQDIPDDHLALGNPARSLPLGLVNRDG